eukprot:Platyproteum_vivax@DN3122_c0_g1_i1.p1
MSSDEEDTKGYEEMSAKEMVELARLEKAADMACRSFLSTPITADSSTPVTKKRSLEQATCGGHSVYRGEFDNTYECEAELAVAEMCLPFDSLQGETPNEEWDAPALRQAKYSVLSNFAKILQHRQVRNDFFINRNLLSNKAMQQGVHRETRTAEEAHLWVLHRSLLRLLPQHEFEHLIQLIIEERNLRSRSQQLRQVLTKGWESTTQEPLALMNFAGLPVEPFVNDVETKACEYVEVPVQSYVLLKRAMFQQFRRLGVDCSNATLILQRTGRLVDVFLTPRAVNPFKKPKVN